MDYYKMDENDNKWLEAQELQKAGLISNLNKYDQDKNMRWDQYEYQDYVNN